MATRMIARVLAVLLVSAGVVGATTIIATHTPASPVLISDVGPATYSFSLDFPGASFPGAEVLSADFHFVFDDAADSSQSADVALTDAGSPYVMVWDDITIADSPTPTTLDMTWYPTTVVGLDGGGVVYAASAFGYITNGSDDWDLLLGTGLLGLALWRRRRLR